MRNSTKYPPPDYDTWLLRGSGIDEDEHPTDFEFNMKLRGGIVKVQCTSEYQDDSDEDGRSWYMAANVNSVTWAFSEDFEVEPDEREKREIQARAKLEMEEIF